MIKKSKIGILLGLSYFLIALSFVQAQEPVSQSQLAQTELATTKKVDVTVRFGMGGFKDSRSPSGDLGGSQLALDIKPNGRRFALSLSTEGYTNSRNPTHSYEISTLYSINVLYVDKLFEFDKVNYFIGGGLGKLKVPGGDLNLSNKVNGTLYNVEAGINVLVWRNFGLYGVVKYLSAEKSVNNTEAIDFDEVIFLVGGTYNFGL